MTESEKDLKIKSLNDENEKLKNELKEITKKFSLTRRLLNEMLSDLGIVEDLDDEIETLIDIKEEST